MVCAPTFAIQVQPGDRVAAGLFLGFLEAMKVEIAFSAPTAGVVSLDGRMIDRPHLLQAQRILAVAERARGGT